MKLRLDWFLCGMLAAVALAWVWPSPGTAGGFLHPEILNKLGVALIFFFHGLGLPLAQLKSGILQWRLHLLVQLATFLLFPILGLLLDLLFHSFLDPALRAGIFYLCALPSTISSSVALTAVARGNVPVALFNASLSGVLGVFLTPLWMGLFYSSAGHAIPVGKVMLDLSIWLILPLVCGQLARPWLGAWAAANKKMIGGFDRGTILFLVYTSFCDSMRWGIWTGKGSGAVAISLAVSIFLFWAVFAVLSFTCRRFHLPTADRIAVLLCGSKKTLASGIPMAQLLFGGRPELGMILLPIMVYHPFQLVICGVLAEKWGKRTASQ